MIGSIFFFFFMAQSVYAQNYYLYVASESDDTVSLLKFDGTTIVEKERINVGSYPTEIEGPHGITIDPNGRQMEKNQECLSNQAKEIPN